MDEKTHKSGIFRIYFFEGVIWLATIKRRASYVMDIGGPPFVLFIEWELACKLVDAVADFV